MSQRASRTNHYPEHYLSFSLKNQVVDMHSGTCLMKKQTLINNASIFRKLVILIVSP